MKLLGAVLVLVLYIVTLTVTGTTDLPCAARPIYNKSVVCVCNCTYCDNIIRQQPQQNKFVYYTTSKRGSRLKKSFGSIETIDNCPSDNPGRLVLCPENKYQKIKGFGGAVTDSVAIIYKGLPAELQEYLMQAYFSKEGIEYNIIRVPIGASDFSIRTYSLDDCPGDVELKKFSLQVEDLEYKIPMIKEAMKVSKTKVNVFGTAWSAPSWMKVKTPRNPSCGYLQNKYFQVYANYLLKFLECYKAEGVPIWAITTGNQPFDAYLPYPLNYCLGWATNDLGDWIVNNLGPTIRNSSECNDVKILAMDDDRYSLKLVFEPMINVNKKVLDYIDAFAVHYYADNYIKPDILSEFSKQYSKFVISTEASTGIGGPDMKGPVLGSWQHALEFAKDIIEDLNNDVVAWVDWNMFLNTEGGPSVEKNYLDAAIIVDVEKEEFIKQPMFYILGQFSKFIPRNSQRIELKAQGCTDLHYVAFLTPYDTIVVVICNKGLTRSTVLEIGNKEIVVQLEEESLTTVEFCNDL